MTIAILPVRSARSFAGSNAGVLLENIPPMATGQDIKPLGRPATGYMANIPQLREDILDAYSPGTPMNNSEESGLSLATVAYPELARPCRTLHAVEIIT